MKFRSKLILLFVAVALVTNGALFSMLYWNAQRLLLQQMGSTALSVAATTAALVDPDTHAKLQKREDENTPAYREIENVFRRARDANRRDDVYVKFLYSMVPQATNKSVVQFVVDPEESTSDKSHLGDVFKPKAHSPPIDFEHYQVMPGFQEDQWGTWLTVNAPIKNQNNLTIGAIGVDLKASDVIARIRRLFYGGILSLVISVGLAVGAALFLSRKLTEPLAGLHNTLAAVGAGDLETHLPVQSKDEFGEMAESVNKMVAGLRQRENLKSTLVRYVSSHVAESVLKSGQIPDLKGERRKITVLFADVRGFTTLSERLSPEEVVHMLDDYFDKMIEAIFRNKGMLNKFLGDGLMAVFGAPIDDPYQEEHAIQAALEMKQAIQALQEKWKTEGKEEFRIGIGINTGIAVVGNIGSKQRMEYTAIGDTVNLASRLESSSKILGRDIIVSEYTYVAARNKFQFVPLQSIEVKGRSDSVKVFGVQC